MNRIFKCRIMIWRILKSRTLEILEENAKSFRRLNFFYFRYIFLRSKEHNVKCKYQYFQVSSFFTTAKLPIYTRQKFCLKLTSVLLNTELSLNHASFLVLSGNFAFSKKPETWQYWNTDEVRQNSLYFLSFF